MLSLFSQVFIWLTGELPFGIQEKTEQKWMVSGHNIYTESSLHQLGQGEEKLDICTRRVEYMSLARQLLIYYTLLDVIMHNGYIVLHHDYMRSLYQIETISFITPCPII